MTTTFTTYTDPQNIRHDWTADSSRLIANQFPDHHTFRRDVNSVGFQFLNTMAGQHVEELRDLVDRGLQDSFLPTLNLDASDHYWSVQFDEAYNLETPQNTKNLILNSSFELQSSSLWFSDWWDWDGNGTVNFSTGIRSNRSLLLNGAIVAQEIDRAISNHDPLAFSLWYKGGGAASSAYVRLTLADNTTEDVVVALPNTSVWTRASVTQASRTKKVQKLVVYIATTDDLYVDNVQLERSPTITEYRPNIFESYFWMESGATQSPVAAHYPYYVQFAGKAGLPQTSTNFYYQLPNRAGERTQEAINQLQRRDEYPIGVQTDFWGDRRPIGLRKNGNYIQRYSIGPGDAYVNYSLRFWTLDGQFVAKDYTLECFTVFRNRVWAVIQAEDWRGASGRFLAIAPYRTPQTGIDDTPSTQTDYLEVWCDLPLPSEREVFRISISNQNPEVVHLFDGHYHDAVRLYYDYYAIDPRRGELLFRHEYNNLSIIFQNERVRSAE